MDATTPNSGPLAGLRVLEFGAIGPVPYAAMLLADMGADVVHIARPADGGDLRLDAITLRGRRIVPLDLKAERDKAIACDLAASADILLEGARPGVMERLGLGPDDLLARNPRLVYGRMTGWGQSGPRATSAGHDINYIALTGALHAMGRPGEPPAPPLNLVGDYGGGSMFLLFGVLCALHEAKASGKGQVVDAAMVDGVASMMAFVCGLRARGQWSDERGANMLDGGAPWYDVYTAADGGFVAIGALEEPFWRALLQKLDIDGEALPPRRDVAGWPVIRSAIAAAIARRTRDEWAKVFATGDACATPVLSLAEAMKEAHNSARGAYVEQAGVTQPAPAPRLSRTPGAIRPTLRGDAVTQAVLRDWAAR